MKPVHLGMCIAGDHGQPNRKDHTSPLPCTQANAVALQSDSKRMSVGTGCRREQRQCRRSNRYHPQHRRQDLHRLRPGSDQGNAVAVQRRRQGQQQLRLRYCSRSGCGLAVRLIEGGGLVQQQWQQHGIPLGALPRRRGAFHGRHAERIDGQRQYQGRDRTLALTPDFVSATRLPGHGSPHHRLPQSDADGERLDINAADDQERLGADCCRWTWPASLSRSTR